MMTSLFKKKPAVVAKTARKRGRPVGSKNKPKQKPAASSKTFKQPNNDAAIHRLMDANLSLIKDNNQLLKVIENLEHQIIGFRAVVSYLEAQAGLRVTQ